MSYILDALKKTEREKARKERHTGVTDLSGDLFNDGPSRDSSSLNILKISVVVVLVSLVTFGLTWYLLQGGKGQKSQRTSSQSVAVLQTQPSPTPTATVTSPVLPSPASAVKSLPPQMTSQSPSTAAGLQPVQSVMQPDATGIQEPDDNEGRARRSPRTASIPPKAPSTQAQQQNDFKTPIVSTPGDIKVSGIAWQDERRARRAVVNGFLLHEGSVVSGAKIIEILQDRVRFSQEGRTFDVSLISASMPLNK